MLDIKYFALGKMKTSEDWAYTMQNNLFKFNIQSGVLWAKYLTRFVFNFLVILTHRDLVS